MTAMEANDGLKGLRSAWGRMRQEFDDLEARLRERGFRIAGRTDVVPIQLWGWLPTGEPFYFRARGTVASLEVYELGRRIEFGALEHVAWRDEVERWSWPEASALDAEEAEQVLWDLLQRYEQRDGPR